MRYGGGALRGHWDTGRGTGRAGQARAPSRGPQGWRGSHFGAGRGDMHQRDTHLVGQKGLRESGWTVCRSARQLEVRFAAWARSAQSVLIGKMPTRRSTSKTVSHWRDSPECEASTTLRLAPAAAAADGNGVQTRGWGAAHSLRHAGWRGRSA